MKINNIKTNELILVHDLIVIKLSSILIATFDCDKTKFNINCYI